MKCRKCGSEMRIWSEQVGIQNGIAVYNNFGYCDRCKEKVNIDALESQHYGRERKHSTLSIIACVLSIFVCTLPIGFIIALIDLCMNDKTKKHIGSWFSVCIGGILIFLFLYKKPETENANSSNENIETTQNGNIQYSKGVSFDTDQCKITIDSANMNYTNYEDEYSLYKPENGMKYVYVTFTYENTSNSDAYVSIYDYDCYADRELMQQCFYFGGDFINANISPGRKVSFSTTYIVPKDSESIELEYKGNNLFDDNTIVITLQ